MQEGFQASAYTFNMPLKKQLRRKRQLWSVWGHWTHSLDQLGLGLRTLLHGGLKSGIYFSVNVQSLERASQSSAGHRGSQISPQKGLCKVALFLTAPPAMECHGVPAITSLSRVGNKRTDEGGCGRLPPSGGCLESLAFPRSRCITPASATTWPFPSHMAVSCPLSIRTPVSGSSCVVLVAQSCLTLCDPQEL